MTIHSTSSGQVCQWCETQEATHTYKDKQVCLEHYTLFTEADKQERELANYLEPVLKAWLLSKVKEGFDAPMLEGVIAGYATGADSPFTLEAIQKLIAEATSAE
jgi:hypothetical protein